MFSTKSHDYFKTPESGALYPVKDAQVVWLVDGDFKSLYWYARLIGKSRFVDRVELFESVDKCIKEISSGVTMPDLIMVDTISSSCNDISRLNLLQTKLRESGKGASIVLMSSQPSDDQINWVNEVEYVAAYLQKPLTSGKIDKVLHYYSRIFIS